jgi:hypothetical protein
MLQLNENLPVTDLPYLSGGGLPPGVYYFHQLHFHWGSDVSRGSEHRIADQPYMKFCERCFYKIKLKPIFYNEHKRLIIPDSRLNSTLSTTMENTEISPPLPHFPTV